MSESVSTARDVSYRVLIRVREARLPSVASALAFTTLLSLVPLMTVGFAILAVFPAFDAWRGQVESLLYTNLIPATSDVVSSYLQEFSGQAGTLTGAWDISCFVTLNSITQYETSTVMIMFQSAHTIK